MYITTMTNESENKDSVYYNPNRLQIGDKVRHRTYSLYGIGTVVGFHWKGVEVKFENHIRPWPTHYGTSWLNKA